MTAAPCAMWSLPESAWSPRAGEGVDAHLAALWGAPPRIDAETFAPFPVHPVVRGRIRQADPEKVRPAPDGALAEARLLRGGLALDAAGAKDDAALKSRMHLIVAAGGGERDYAVDGQILTGLRDARKSRRLPQRAPDGRPAPDPLPGAALQPARRQHLASCTASPARPAPSWARKPSGVDAIRIAHERIASGQNDIFLVGGAYNAERPDVLLIYEMGGFLWKKPFRPVFERAAEGGGMILGSGAAFLVLEAREHAQARGAKPLASLAGIASDRARREAGSVCKALDAMGVRARAPSPTWCSPARPA